MKSPIKNLVNILKNDFNYNTSVIFETPTRQDAISLQWFESEEKGMVFRFVDWKMDIKDFITIQAMYKHLDKMIKQYDLKVQEIER